MKHFEEAAELWRTYVPARGQAETVQGELMRAVEKPRDEAQRNGNINWNDGHVVLAEFVRLQLIGSGLFDAVAWAEIDRDVDRLLDSDRPETSDEIYDGLTDRIVEWSRMQLGPVGHFANSGLAYLGGRTGSSAGQDAFSKPSACERSSRSRPLRRLLWLCRSS